MHDLRWYTKGGTYQVGTRLVLDPATSALDPAWRPVRVRVTETEWRDEGPLVHLDVHVDVGLS